MTKLAHIRFRERWERDWREPLTARWKGEHQEFFSRNISVFSKPCMCWFRNSKLDMRERFISILDNRNGIFKMRGERAVFGYKCLAIFRKLHLPAAKGYHGLDTNDHTLFECFACMTFSIIWNLRLLVQLLSDAMPA